MARLRTLKEILDVLQRLMPLVAERYDVEEMQVFGSYVRGEQSEDSDVDILINYRAIPTLLSFIALENYLSDQLGVRVDLVMKDSLKPAIGQRILREAALQE